jgi:macrolide transport system ATP-binding/permease protein
MNWIANFVRRLRADRELDLEVDAHLEERMADLMDSGTPEREAREKARREFGNVALCTQDSREVWACVWLETLLQDLRYAVRMLRKSPEFTLVAVLSLAIGIGVNSAMFSLADGLLLRPLSVRRPGEVVTVSGKTPSDPSARISYRDYVDFRDRSRSFAGLVAYGMSSFGFSARSGDLSQMKVGFLVSGNLFRAMGVEPELGRSFLPEEDQVPGRDAVLVLGHDFWEKDLAADPSIVGRKVRLNGIEFTVIGVAPERFTGMDQYMRPAMFVPLAMAPRLATNPKSNILEQRNERRLSVKGRLRAGTNMAQAQSELVAIAKGLERTYPDTNRDRSVALSTELQARIQDNPQDAALVAMLMVLAALVLLVACANVANLLLSRARVRTREIAIRLAIGAGRMRLIRQLLAESLAIALAGGLASLLFAYAGAAFLGRIRIPSDMPIVFSVKVDQRMLWFSLAVSLASTVLFGLVPALQASRTDLLPVLKAADADSSRKQRLWGRSTLVVAQVALSLVLMVVAAMLFRGFRADLMGGPGFRTDHLAMMSFDPALVRYSDAQTQQFYKALRVRALATPGVKSAALTMVMPMAPNQHSENLVPEGYQMPKGRDNVTVLADAVDERYFDTMAVPIVRGRGFRESDTAAAPRVAIVNEELARLYWPNRDAVGKRFKLDDSKGPWVEIVGIAKTAKYLWIGESPTGYLYFPMAQHPSPFMTLVAQSSGDAAALVAPLREMVRGLDASQPVYDVRTMSDFYEARAISIPSMINQTVAAIGLVGLLLAMIGLYGLMAYSVARRTREIGIRMAIGADRGSVSRMVLRQGFILAVTGLAIGLAASLGAETGVNAVFGNTGRDPLAYLLVAPALLAVTMLAAWAPAHRASRVDPMRALRDE